MAQRTEGGGWSEPEPEGWGGGGGTQPAMGGAEPLQGGPGRSLLGVGEERRPMGELTPQGGGSALRPISTWWKAKALSTRGALLINT